VNRLRRLLRGERGYSLIETLTVMAILGTVMAGITGLFVSGSRAEIDMNKRFQAQLNARLALDKLRREVHCSNGLPTYSATSVTIALASYCKTGSGQFTWCTVGSGTRYALYRKPGATCDATGVKWADFLTSASVFSYTPQSTQSLARLHVDFPVDLDPADTSAGYRLQDGIALRNSSRS